MPAIWMQTTSALFGTRPVLQLAAVDHVPSAAASQESVQLGVAALGVAEANDTMPAEPIEAKATATAAADVRSPRIIFPLGSRPMRTTLHWNLRAIQCSRSRAISRPYWVAGSPLGPG